MKKVLAFLIAILTFVAISVVGAGTASASHEGRNVWNKTTTSTFNVRCWDHFGVVFIFAGIGPNETTYDSQCNAFSVGDTRNVKYKSRATGAYYWSGCGRFLPHNDPDVSGYGWAHIGNDVDLVQVVTC